MRPEALSYGAPPNATSDVPAAHTLPAVAPELALLLCCARVLQTPETAQRIATLVSAGVDWSQLVALAREHAVLPLLHRGLSSSCPEILPAHIAAELREHCQTVAARNLWMTRELLRAVDALERRGIPVLPWKGPLLAVSVYRNAALRDFADLDLLLRRQDVLRAKDVLASLDYRPAYRLSPAQEASLLRWEHHYRVVSSAPPLEIELHWQISAKPPLRLDVESVLRRARTLRVGGVDVRALSPEDDLLAAVMHGVRHRWTRLLWLCDVAELIRTNEALDWHRLWAEARARDYGKCLALGLLLAHQLLDVPLPLDVLRAVSDARVAKLAARVPRILAAPRTVPTGDLGKYAYWGSLRQRFTGSLHVFASGLLSPTITDIEGVSLPPALAGLYYAVRLLRIGRSHVRAMRGRPRDTRDPV